MGEGAHLMAIERTEAVVRCDSCALLIQGADRMVEAMVYGATLHHTCFLDLKPLELLKLLGLDQINIGRRSDFDAQKGWWEDPEKFAKLIYSKE